MIYNFFRIILYPFLLIFFIFKPKKVNFFTSRIFQDFSSLNDKYPYIWIHCSSVGEVNLCDSLISKLLEKKSEKLLLTVFTDTGFEIAKKKYSSFDEIKIFKFPLDDSFSINRILNRINLKYLLLIETELWPNLINLASKKCKIILINGRISNRSYPRYKKIKFFLTPLFKKINVFCMQTEEDRKKIVSLGANETSTYALGNLKFDISFPKYSQEEKKYLLKILNALDKKILVAGSIREGEEEILIDVFKNYKNLLLILVPRHLERVEKIENILKKHALSYTKFSHLTFENKNHSSVVLVDKMGVLRKFYSICDFAFVGGTLVNIGGHSLLEPLYYGKTPIFGPYLQNVREISNEILKLNIGYKIENYKEFIDALNEIQHKKMSEEMIDIFFQQNKNITENILKFMEA